MNTGPCVGGPLDGTPAISNDSDTLRVRVANFEGGTHDEPISAVESVYHWREHPRFQGVVVLADGTEATLSLPLYAVCQGELTPALGYWEWEHHQERDDLPADRN